MQTHSTTQEGDIDGRAGGGADVVATLRTLLPAPPPLPLHLRGCEASSSVRNGAPISATTASSQGATAGAPAQVGTPPQREQGQPRQGTPHAATPQDPAQALAHGLGDPGGEEEGAGSGPCSTACPPFEQVVLRWGCAELLSNPGMFSREVGGGCWAWACSGVCGMQ
jgi:hypothetical protein